LGQGKILISTSSDQPGLGKNNEGKFNLKEANCMSLGLEFPNPNKVWKDPWQNQSWIKIKLFTWLVQHKKNSDLGKPEENRSIQSI